MSEHVDFVMRHRLEALQKALEDNNIESVVLDSADEVPLQLERMIPPGSVVAHGGSATLGETGAMDAMRRAGVTFLDREAPGADKMLLHQQAFTADFYLASANAITEQGEVYEIDGRGNRIAAIAYGPKTVILVVGRNKIVPDVAAARRRMADIAAPANTHRLGLRTPCAKTGLCIDCKSAERICCTELVLRRQPTKGRIYVLLVNEDLGF